jgi:hypothetical protein
MWRWARVWRMCNRRFRWSPGSFLCSEQNNWVPLSDNKTHQRIWSRSVVQEAISDYGWVGSSYGVQRCHEDLSCLLVSTLMVELPSFQVDGIKKKTEHSSNVQHRAGVGLSLVVRAVRWRAGGRQIEPQQWQWVELRSGLLLTAAVLPRSTYSHSLNPQMHFCFKEAFNLSFYLQSLAMHVMVQHWVPRSLDGSRIHANLAQTVYIHHDWAATLAQAWCSVNHNNWRLTECL